MKTARLPRLLLAMTLAGLLPLAVLSCGDPPAPPCAETCDGCCTEEGVCRRFPQQSLSACGLGGAACEVCPDGQVCSVGRCTPSTVEEPDGGGGTCGTQGEACCAKGPACGSGLSCEQGVCEAGGSICGGPDEPCCLSQCDDGLVCTAGTCRPSSPPPDAGSCGAKDEACCATSPRCDAALECVQGSCLEVPDAGQPDAGTQDAGVRHAVGEACSAGTQCAQGSCKTVGYPEGYCTRTCSSASDCPSGSRCGPNPLNQVERICLDACTTPGTRSDCREGYVCDRNGHQPEGGGVCVPSCQGDSQCPGDVTCNTSTGFCCGALGYACCPGQMCEPGAECGQDGFCKRSHYGSKCESNANCADNRCITSANPGWTEGYCSGTCLAGANACPNAGGGCSPVLWDSIDTDRNLCLRLCTPSADGQGDCREGYVCDVNWTDTAGQTVCVAACNDGNKAAVCGSGVRCVSGFCCGQPGYACCKSGAACDTGSSCQAGICQ